jgi:hypothetical protein
MTVEEVYTNNFDSTYTAWTETGVTPYLHDSDADYISRASSTLLTYKEGNWSFPSSAGYGTIYSVKLRLEMTRSDVNGDAYLYIYVWDGSSWVQLSPFLIPSTVYAWYEFDVSSILNTWAKINGAKVYVELGLASVTDTTYIRRLTRKVDYAPWWLLPWKYRKRHVINAASGAGTNYQVKVKVHYGSGTDSGEDVYVNSHCRSDFGDVRFTDDDGVTQLDYWMEEKVDGDYAVFWVEVADDLSSQNRTIYIYYGKADAVYPYLASDTAHGEATFLFFDHFVDLSKWSGDTQYASVADSIMSWKVTVAAWKQIINNLAVPINASLRAKINFATGYGSKPWTWGLGTDDTHDIEYDVAGTTTARMKRLKTYNGSGTTVESNFTLSTYRIQEIFWKNGSAAFYQDGTQLQNSPITTNVPTADKNVWYRGYNMEAYVYTDWLFIRKWVDPEPSHGGWGSEETAVAVKKPIMKMDLGPHPRSRLLFAPTLILKGSGGSAPPPPPPPLWDDWDYLWVAVL